MTQLSIIDYVVFGLSLSASTLIGFYYYFTGGKQRTNREYLHGNKEMGVIPVAVSLMASFVSAITLLGVSSEMYIFGTQFFVVNFAYLIGTPIAAFVFLPVFYNLNMFSAYEYLERRFNRSVRLCASMVFMIQMTLYMGIVLYAPALALSAVTGLSKWAAIISVGLVCAIYCTAGGIKAVLWTDVLQSLLMFAAIIAVSVKGVIEVGGFNEVYKRAFEGDRLQLWNFDPDPTVRHSVWTLGFGGIFVYLSLYAVNQTEIQRLLTVSSLRKSQIALFVSWPVLLVLSSTTCFSGIVMYAFFKDCDPLLNGDIQKRDELLPYFMVRTLSSMPGLPGLFVAGIFSGALSSLSSFVNSLAAVTLEDYVKPMTTSRMSEGREALVTKVLAMFFAVLCICLTYVAEQFAGILQASMTIFGVVGGPLLGLFTLGMCSRKCTSNAAFISFATSLTIGLWIGFGALNFAEPPEQLPTSTSMCSRNDTVLELLSILSTMLPLSDTKKVFYLYRLSYMYYAAFTFAISIITGLLISAIWPDGKHVDDSLISPVFGGGITCKNDRSNEMQNTTAQLKKKLREP